MISEMDGNNQFDSQLDEPPHAKRLKTTQDASD
jgi:hypothetical protein